MSSYGDYHIIQEIGWSNGATLYSARKETDEHFAVKVFSLAFFGFAGDNDIKAEQFANLFNSRLENQKKAASQSPRFAPIFQEGFDNDEAWYVTRLYSNSVQKLIESHAELRKQDFFNLVSAIVEATREFKKICGRSHGNVKATNVFLTKPGKTALNEIVLGDAAPGNESKAGDCEMADLRGIGEILHRLVINENREEEYWKLPPAPSLQEWVGVFGKDAEAWRSLCARLLEPDLTIHHYNLEELAFDLARLKTQPKFSQKQLLTISAVVLLVAIAAVFGIKQFTGGRAESRDVELRQKKMEEQASRLTKEKRAAEERADAEAKARQQTEQRSDAQAKRLAQEKRAAEERALVQSKAGEEARRKAEAAESARREAAQRLAEEETLLKDSEARQAAEQRQQQEKQNAAAVAAPTESRAPVKTKPSAGAVWSNSLGMRFVPIPKPTILVCAWETRRKDFEEFVRVSLSQGSTGWRATTFKQGGSEPVVNVDAADAKQFCQWLTESERKQGLLSAKQSYRLPTDSEWSEAAGVKGPVSGAEVFAWGPALPPPVGAGNFAPWCGYDRFSFTAPVAQFHPNQFGIYDLAGNAWEICQNGSVFIGRGSSWQTELPDELNLFFRLPLPAGERRQDVGFRCVLDLDSAN